MSTEKNTNEIVHELEDGKLSDPLINPQSPNHIFCYTGTGNSFAAAKQFSSFFGDIPITFITQELVENPQPIVCEFAVIFAPSYGYGLPKLVRRWLKSTSFKIGYLAVCILQGSSMRGTAAEAIRILKRKKQAVHFVSGVDSVENYVHLFGHPSDEFQEERFQAQILAVQAICEKLQNRERVKVRTFSPLSKFVSVMFRGAVPMFITRYRVTEHCNACEICRKICPPKAITMKEKNGRTLPHFKARMCDHCQACMQLCPKQAIRYFKIKPNSPRYKHKDVVLKELIKRD